jgi:hypothetical protein
LSATRFITIRCGVQIRSPPSQQSTDADERQSRAGVYARKRVGVSNRRELDSRRHGDKHGFGGRALAPHLWWCALAIQTPYGCPAITIEFGRDRQARWREPAIARQCLMVTGAGVPLRTMANGSGHENRANLDRGLLISRGLPVGAEWRGPLHYRRRGHALELTSGPHQARRMDR